MIWASGAGEWAGELAVGGADALLANGFPVLLFTAMAELSHGIRARTSRLGMLEDMLTVAMPIW